MAEAEKAQMERLIDDPFYDALQGAPGEQPWKQLNFNRENGELCCFETSGDPMRCRSCNPRCDPGGYCLTRCFQTRSSIM